VTCTRVAQWATGSTGSLALGAVIDDPGLDLVAVCVYDPAKVGVDAGQLVGRDPVGVLATDDADAVLGSTPGVVLYMGSVESHPDECFSDVAQLLRSGVDVIATGSSFIDVFAFDADRAAVIDEACRTGGSSFLGLGLFPGFWGESIAPVLSRFSANCDNIMIREAMSYAGYPSRQLLVDVMGYGQAPDSTAPALSDPERPGRIRRHGDGAGQGIGIDAGSGRGLPRNRCDTTGSDRSRGRDPGGHRRSDQTGCARGLRAAEYRGGTRDLARYRGRATLVGARGIRDRIRRGTDHAVQPRFGNGRRRPHRDGLSPPRCTPSTRSRRSSPHHPVCSTWPTSPWQEQEATHGR
jgi:hypothetical protein